LDLPPCFYHFARTRGTITDSNGRYTLGNIPENARLQFSFVGMKSQEIVVGTRTIINVSLAEETVGIDEVVAIGYGTIKKSDLTGAVSQVSSDVIRTQSVTKDPLQVLQGKVPGLDITTGNKPGDVSTPIIRGYNSINASNATLIVLDGAPFGGRLSDINPSEIESIDVLKDASSTERLARLGSN
jgi:outer membrane receptor protein involved in Fe transport